jgi:CheY-like chemotaxis protein
MISDPFYRQILERLATRLNGDLFEACASALLRKDFPTLVPIPGGTDSGMDGTTAGHGPFLICTTSKDVIGNLTKNLTSYLQSGGSRRSILIATSQELTQTRRANLEKSARGLGFNLRHIYDQAALADRLYHEPRWCKELLGLTGRPSALTVIPRTERPLLDQILIGREDAFRWLQGSSGDRLLIGQPGCGKTFLLRSLALKGWGLFLVDSDIEAIAVAIRSQQPKVIIVDDAHSRLEMLTTLRHLREEVRADFEIVTTSWEGDKQQVAEVLSLPNSRIHQLELLTRDEIVEVIKQTGLIGSVELLREIVDQAEGRPGLAVTLSYLCLNGDARDVFLGEALNRSIGITFQRLVGDMVNSILGAFAIGGDHGMPMDIVAGVLGIPIAQLRLSLSRLAAGGVLRQGREGNLSVWPRTLRYILVRDTFFGGKCNLPSAALIQDAPDKWDMAETLIGAISRGANVPDMVGLLESIGSSTLWRDYASLGEDEAKFVLRRHPELLHSIGEVTLLLVPYETLPMLLKAAVGDRRKTHNTPEHPLRWIEDWIQAVKPESGEAVLRRQILIDAVARWLREGGDERITLRALALALKPTSQSISTDPGSGMKVTISSWLLTKDELSRFNELWRQAKEIAITLSYPDWQELFDVARMWVYPEAGTRVETIPPDIKQEMRSIAVQIVEDIVALSREHPGLQQKVKRYTDKLGLEVELSTDAEFEILFPEIDRDDVMESLQEESRQVLALAEKWKTLSPAEASRRLLFLENEAALANKRSPRWTVYLCEQIARETADPSAWLDEFMAKGLPADTGEPFLRKAIATQAPEWERVIAECINKPQYAWIAVSVLLTLHDMPDDLLNQATEKASEYPDLIETLCLRNQVPEHTIMLLLRSQNPAVSINAAVGAWYGDPKEQIQESIAADWKAAMLRAEDREFWISEILKSDSSLAFEWLVARLETKTNLIPFYIWQEVEAAISVLDVAQRIALLQWVDGSGPMDSTLIAKLAGNDLLMYREILRHERLSKLHLAPLNEHPVGNWSEKAILALEAGYSPEQIASATLKFGDESWVGNISQMWHQWVQDFEALNTHPDERVRKVGGLGATKALEHERMAAASEHREAVYGQ